MLKIFAFCVIVAGASAGPGTCPEAIPMNNFDYNKYAQGRWFEIARYPEFPVEAGADCVFFDYVSGGKDTICLLHEVVDKKEKIINTTVALAPDAGTTAKMFYEAFKQYVKVTVYMLDTDYNNYSIFYYCTVNDATQIPVEVAWIKARAPSLKPEVKASVDKFIKSHPILVSSRFMWDHFTHDDCLIDV